MNSKQLLARIANMDRRPTQKEWAEIQTLAKKLTLQDVIDLIIDDPLKTRYALRQDPASRSDTRQCSPH